MSELVELLVRYMPLIAAVCGFAVGLVLRGKVWFQMLLTLPSEILDFWYVDVRKLPSARRYKPDFESHARKKFGLAPDITAGLAVVITFLAVYVLIGVLELIYL